MPIQDADTTRDDLTRVVDNDDLALKEAASFAGLFLGSEAMFPGQILMISSERRIAMYAGGGRGRRLGPAAEIATSRLAITE